MKDTNNKTKCTKKRRLTAQQVADILDCAPSYVSQVRRGVNGRNSPLGQQIRLIDSMVGNSTEQFDNALVNHIKDLVKV